ncbi:outer spore coat copper-dependent laccase CotA [Oleiagrimonas citrea]|uniref:Multicopper oxidase domain-containing protein n=1 Tax=Oleiagrimonas citrea TaxID=1665687 RepID=A0A846ZK36_9GAMM|nr:multicopper oxidase domain-containing protein [Oleiagrimonas citrea]NKZ37943.1 multicopper oxidase domain-containing protein [Oleiagrimonas citrea]
MPLTRRHFLQAGLLAGAAPWLRARAAVAATASAPTLIDPRTLHAFVDPLPIPPVPHPERIARIDGAAVPHYRIVQRQVHAKLHRDLPPARLWVYGDSMPGPTLDVRAGQGMTVEWVNALPAKHFLPVDHTLMGSNKGQPDVRTVTHVHGGRTPPDSDGWPTDTRVPGQSQTYRYPLNQEAATLWYHDHAMGVARLNHYAGMMGMCLVRDAHEDALRLPRGEHELPLVLCDRLITAKGQLHYPVSENPKSPWVPEVFGNAVLVNGKLLPYMQVEPRRYRLRVVNAANGRFFRLRLSDGRPLVQIGSDQGLLHAPVDVEQLVLAPAERADLIVDFAPLAGKDVRLTNDGDPHGIVQFRVADSGRRDDSVVPDVLRDVPRLAASQAVRERNLTLNEYEHLSGLPMKMLLDGKYWHEKVTETPRLGDVEIWNLINLTDDSHPIHLHMVRFQILERRRFDSFAYRSRGTLRYTGAPQAPAPNELGWKDVAQAHGGMVTRIIVPFDGYAGRYVWHCHILEHAANEMMRPFEVRPRKA